MRFCLCLKIFSSLLALLYPSSHLRVSLLDRRQNVFYPEEKQSSRHPKTTLENYDLDD